MWVEIKTKQKYASAILLTNDALSIQIICRPQKPFQYTVSFKEKANWVIIN